MNRSELKQLKLRSRTMNIPTTAEFRAATEKLEDDAEALARFKRKRDNQLIGQMFGQEMWQYLRDMRVEYFASIHVPASAANPKLGRSSGASSGGMKFKQSIDLVCVEMWVDFRLALKARRWREAYTTYCSLKRLTNT
jgi:hypothetical protein